MKIHLSSAAETMSPVISLSIGRKIDLEVFPSSACPSVLFLWTRYLKSASGEFRQMHYKCPLGLKDGLIQFRW